MSTSSLTTSLFVLRSTKVEISPSYAGPFYWVLLSYLFIAGIVVTIVQASDSHLIIYRFATHHVSFPRTRHFLVVVWREQVMLYDLFMAHPRRARVFSIVHYVHSNDRKKIGRRRA